MSYNRYQGTISKVNVGRRYGWISRKTVLEEDGSPANLITTKDIFVHFDDCRFTLRVGMPVRFTIVDDSRRELSFRAINVQELKQLATSGPPAFEIHADDRVIENPSVSIRWCFSGAMHAHVIEGLKQGKGYAVLLTARRREYDEMGYREIREIKDWSQPFTIISFSKPGDWTVDAILFERENLSSGENTTNSLKLALKHRFLLKRRRNDPYDSSIPAISDIEFPSSSFRRGFYLRVSDHEDHGVAIAAYSLKLSVPKEVFAAEPSKALKSYANYFFRHSPYDECDFRRRLMIMIPGFIPWIANEFVKRASTIVLALLACLLFCVKGSLKMAGHAFLPKIKFSIDEVCHECFEDNEWGNGLALVGPWKRKGGLYYTPAAVIIYVIILEIVAKMLFVLFFLMNIAAQGTWHRVISPHKIATTVMIAAILAYFWRKHLKSLWAKEKKTAAVSMSDIARARQRRLAHEEAQRLQTIRLAERQALIAERNATALVCGDAPAKVELKALPPELRTMDMWFRSAKRAVCRPFA